MPSFDIVSKPDMQEIDNAVNSSIRELNTRYDFKDCNSKFEFDKKEITIYASSDYKLKTMHEILKVHATRRKVDIKFFEFKDPEKAAGQSLRQVVNIKNGIDTDNARKIIKIVKDSKIKVSVSNRGDKVRVEGKKIDDLQSVIKMLTSSDLDISISFENFL